MIECLLYGKMLQIGVEFLLVNDKYIDNIDFFVDSDVISDVSNDVISIFFSDNCFNSKNIDEIFFMDMFILIILCMYFEMLVNSIKEG